MKIDADIRMAFEILEQRHYRYLTLKLSLGQLENMISDYKINMESSKQITDELKTDKYYTNPKFLRKNHILNEDKSILNEQEYILKDMQKRCHSLANYINELIDDISNFTLEKQPIDSDFTLYLYNGIPIYTIKNSIMDKI
jgi:hypothetical protein